MGDDFRLQELEAAEYYVARGREIIDRLKDRRVRVKATGGSLSPESDKLLEVLGITQQLFESHLDLVRREQAPEE